MESHKSALVCQSFRLIFCKKSDLETIDMCLDLARGILDFKRSSRSSDLFILAKTIVSGVLRNIEFM